MASAAPIDITSATYTSDKPRWTEKLNELLKAKEAVRERMQLAIREEIKKIPIEVKAIIPRPPADETAAAKTIREAAEKDNRNIDKRYNDAITKMYASRDVAQHQYEFNQICEAISSLYPK